MIKPHTFFLLGSLLFLVARPAAAQYGTASHSVTVTVAEITSVSVSTGSVSLAITGAGVAAGQDLMTTTDQSSSILWGINSSNKKITAKTDLVSPQFALKLLAIGPSRGSAAPEMTLGTTAQDLLLGIGRSRGTATLRYTGIASATQGIGTDSHIITFTVQAQ
jgi:hypothetical protein